MLRQSKRTRPVLMSTSCRPPSKTFPSLHANLARGRQQRGVAWGDLELVDVADHSVTRLDVGDEAIRAVVDRVATVAAAPVRPAVPPRQDRTTQVALHAKVGHSVCVQGSEPDHPAVVVDDQWSGLHDVLLRRDEDVTGCRVPCPLEDLDKRWLQIRLGVVVPCRRGRACCARDAATTRDRQCDNGCDGRRRRPCARRHAGSRTMGPACVRAIRKMGVATIAVAPIASAPTPIASSA